MVLLHIKSNHLFYQPAASIINLYLLIHMSYASNFKFIYLFLQNIFSWKKDFMKIIVLTNRKSQQIIKYLIAELQRKNVTLHTIIAK